MARFECVGSLSSNILQPNIFIFNGVLVSHVNSIAVLRELSNSTNPAAYNNLLQHEFTEKELGVQMAK